MTSETKNEESRMPEPASINTLNTNIIVSISVENPRWRDTDFGVPLENLLETMVRTSLMSADAPALNAAENTEVSLILMDDQTIHSINREYRGFDKPTNVLSFPQLQPKEVKSTSLKNRSFLPLGDILVSLDTIEKEAADQGKDLQDHLAHMIVHGCLHLLGYDHMNNGQADEMETLETAILTGLGYAPPYDNDDE